MKTPLVSLRCVSVSYDGHDALKEVDLDIYPDDFLGIIGPNGGGKTTLVKAIVGTIPYRGTITYSPQLFRGKERLIGYMHTEWRYYDFRYQGKSKTGFVLTGGH